MKSKKSGCRNGSRFDGSAYRVVVPPVLVPVVPLPVPTSIPVPVPVPVWVAVLTPVRLLAPVPLLGCEGEGEALGDAVPVPVIWPLAESVAAATIASAVGNIFFFITR